MLRGSRGIHGRESKLKEMRRMEVVMSSRRNKNTRPANDNHREVSALLNHQFFATIELRILSSCLKITIGYSSMSIINAMSWPDHTDAILIYKRRKHEERDIYVIHRPIVSPNQLVNFSCLFSRASSWVLINGDASCMYSFRCSNCELCARISSSRS